MATRTFIAIGGGTGSGKTTLAERIREAAPAGKVTIIAVDSYYHPQTHLSVAERSELNFDHPNAIDFGLIHDHLRALQRGESVAVPVYDFATHDRRAETCWVEPAPIMIFEGILALHDATIREHCSIKIFVDSPGELCRRRRLERDIRERGRTAESVHKQWQTTVEPMHRQFCEPSRAFADIICPGVGDFKDVLAELRNRLALPFDM